MIPRHLLMGGRGNKLVQLGGMTHDGLLHGLALSTTSDTNVKMARIVNSPWCILHHGLGGTFHATGSEIKTQTFFFKKIFLGLV